MPEKKKMAVIENRCFFVTAMMYCPHQRTLHPMTNPRAGVIQENDQKPDAQLAARRHLVHSQKHQQQQRALESSVGAATHQVSQKKPWIENGGRCQLMVRLRYPPAPSIRRTEARGEEAGRERARAQDQRSENDTAGSAAEWTRAQDLKSCKSPGCTVCISCPDPHHHHHPMRVCGWS